MKKDIPKDFLDEFEARRNEFQCIKGVTHDYYIIKKS